MRVCIDPGHGGKDSGALGTFLNEKDINLKFALTLGKVFEKFGVSVIYTRKNDKYVDLKKRCDIANKNRCDYFISLHCNTSTDPNESGSETYCRKFGGESEKLARIIQKVLVNLNCKDRGVKEGDFYVLKHTNMPSVLIEVMFLSNTDEEKKLNDELWQRIFAQEIAFSLISYKGIELEKNVVERINIQEESKTSIMGVPLAKAEQMEEYVHSRNPDAPYLAKLYLSIGNEEGVRGDIAFTQALLETNFFKFDDGPNIEQHNYIGIRKPDFKGKYESFDTPADGIRAHIQHLKAYASTEGLNSPLVDPIFHLVERGICTYWEDLDDCWFVPKKNYGKRIIQLWREVIGIHNRIYEDMEIYRELKEKGIVTEEKDLNQPVTWREFLIILKRLLRKE